jgi:peptidoglycan/LPS O-acetylase OafA/YrhL
MNPNPPPPSTTPVGRSLQLDGLRGLAIILVFFHHSGVKPPFYVDWGQMGVRLFFVLTGYLITMSLWKIIRTGEASGAGWGRELAVFHLRRFARLMPAFYLALAVGALVGLPDILDVIFWHLGFASNFKMALQGWFFGPTAHFWSLALQEQFYLLWPFAVLLLPRQWFPWFLGIMFCTGYFYRVWCLQSGISDLWRWVMLPGSIDAFALGGLIAWWKTHRGLPELPGSWRKGWWLFLPLAFVWFFNRWLRHHPDEAWLVALPEICEGIVAVFLVAGCIRGFDGGMGWFFSLRFLQYLGRISYGIFVYHLLILYFFEPYLAEFGLGPRSWPLVWSLLMLGVTVLVSAASFRWLEQPILRWSHRVLLPDR